MRELFFITTVEGVGWGMNFQHFILKEPVLQLPVLQFFFYFFIFFYFFFAEYSMNRLFHCMFLSANCNGTGIL